MIGVLAFLTIFGRGRRPEPRQLLWFPVVGALIGAALGGAWWVGHRFWPATVAAALAVVAELVITGLLHVDGLADSADGLLPHLPRERRLEVMATPGVGAYAVAVVAAAVVVEVAAIAALPTGLEAGEVMAGIAGVWALSRGVMAATVCALPYARPGGLAAAYGGRSRARCAGVLVVTLALGFAGGAIARGPAVAAVMVLVTLVGAVLVLWLAWRRLGGYTGDVLGAMGVVIEIVGLLALSARG